MSLSKKLTIWVSGIVLVGLLVLIIVSNNYTNNLLKERENAESMLLGRTIQSAIESELDATKITVQMIANNHRKLVTRLKRLTPVQSNSYLIGR